MFLVVFAHIASCDSLQPWKRTLYIHASHRSVTPHIIHGHGLKYLSLDSRLLYVQSALSETLWFHYGKQRLSILLLTFVLQYVSTENSYLCSALWNI